MLTRSKAYKTKVDYPQVWLPEALQHKVLDILLQGYEQPLDTANPTALKRDAAGCGSVALVCKDWNSYCKLHPSFTRRIRLETYMRTSHTNDWIYLIVSSSKSRDYKRRKLPATIDVEYVLPLPHDLLLSSSSSSSSTHVSTNNLPHSTTLQMLPSLASSSNPETAITSVQAPASNVHAVGGVRPAPAGPPSAVGMSGGGDGPTHVQHHHLLLAVVKRKTPGELASFPSGALILHMALHVKPCPSCASCTPPGTSQQQAHTSQATAATASEWPPPTGHPGSSCSADSAVATPHEVRAPGNCLRGPGPRAQGCTEVVCSAVLPLLLGVVQDLMLLDRVYNAGFIMRVALSGSSSRGADAASSSCWGGQVLRAQLMQPGMSVEVASGQAGGATTLYLIPTYSRFRRKAPRAGAAGPTQ